MGQSEDLITILGKVCGKLWMSLQKGYMNVVFETDSLVVTRVWFEPRDE